MFGRKALQVQVVKAQKPSPENESITSHEYEGPFAIAAGVLNHLGKQIVIGVIAYVALDTVRQCAVAQATKTK